MCKRGRSPGEGFGSKGAEPSHSTLLRSGPRRLDFTDGWLPHPGDVRRMSWTGLLYTSNPYPKEMYKSGRRKKTYIRRGGSAVAHAAPGRRRSGPSVGVGDDKMGRGRSARVV